MRLPGTCIVCRQPVVWNGIAWRRPSGGANHACPTERPTCGAWMPQARERCARGPWHRGDHRSRYAMDNERVSKSPRGYNARDGVSITPPHEPSRLPLTPVAVGSAHLAESAR